MQCDYVLSVHPKFITKLITKCKENLDALQCIDQMLRNNKMKNINEVVRSSLITAYGHCNDVDNALNVFRNIPDSEIGISNINGIMTVLSAHDLHEEALDIFDSISKLKNDRNEITFNLAVRACSGTRDIEKAMSIHHEIEEMLSRSVGSEYIRLKTALMDMYGSCGEMETARTLFDLVDDKSKDTVLIGSMMTVYINNDHFEEGLEIYEQYESLHNEVTHMLAIKAYAERGDLLKCKAIHSLIDSTNIQSQNVLITSYGTNGEVEKAKGVFDDIPDYLKDVASFGAMMTANIQNEQYRDALRLYDDMERINHLLVKNDVIHLLAIKACTASGDLRKGRQIHNEIESPKMDKIANIEVNNALIELYGEWSDIEDVHKVYESMEGEIDSVTVNAMMKVYANNERPENVLNLYEQNGDGLCCDDVTHLMALRACGAVRDRERGKMVHSRIDEKHCSIELKNALITFYGEMEDIESANKVFESVTDGERDIVTVGAMMNALCSNGKAMQCIDLFYKIEGEYGLVANSACFGIVFLNCTKGELLEIGQRIHSELERDGSKLDILQSVDVQTNLVNMYAHFGMVTECERIFEGIKANEFGKYCTEISLWNHMIYAYGRNGQMDRVRALFGEMKGSLVMKPTEKTFVFLFNACSHCGDPKTAIQIWKRDMKDNAMKYNQFVVSALVDCLCRNNHLNAALQLILKYEKKTKHKYVVMWMALLSGCKSKLTQNDLLASFVFDAMQKRFDDSDKHMMNARLIMQSQSSAVFAHSHDPLAS